ncbi:flagellar hook-basal body complex protein [Romboutsia lituseburensis]|uniref:flagellar hook-basal body complex protein n=1 Tax=Romboutsia lituseburensis TaxID=1537 RepID=UPI00215B7686|nr:flagellar hook-basal body complex protein [Romboutsia lituseburensis]MCR8746736.1 flagellar hook-basal body complex protein [Romboutsia lituseburensis]
MYNIMHTSKTGMSANQNKIDIISNNIVNSQTTGYKKLDMEFLDLYTETLDRQSYPHNSKDSVMGTGVKTSQATRNFMQGALKNTGIDTNLAIDGEGFFKVITPDKTQKYTRNGEFVLDGNGRLVDDYGNILEVKYDNGMPPQSADLSNGELSINKAGEVYLDKQKVGKIDLYMPQGDNDLIPVGDSLFVLKEGAGADIIGDKKLLQGHVEMSNVNMQSEMTDLIMAQRAFQFNSRGIKAVDEMWSMINNLQGR